MIYPQPKEKIVLVIGGQEHDMKLISLKLNRYYIPLAARKLIAANPQQKVIIRTGWDQYPEYILSKAFVKMLGGLLDTSAEQSPAYVGSLPTRSKSERLREIDELLESGAITESEHGQARKAILLD